MEVNAFAQDRLLRLPEVETRTGLKKSSIYARMREGTSPSSVRLGYRAVAWPESRINAFVSHLVAQSEAASSQKGQA